MAVALIIAAGIGIFFAVGGETESTPSQDDWPENPQLQATYPAAWRPDRNSGHEEPFVKGRPDSVYILNPGDSTTTVDHYVNGDLAWTVYVQYGMPMNIYNLADDGDPLVLTADADDTVNETLTRLDRNSGDVVWTIDFSRAEWPDLIDGRIFVETFTDDGTQAVVEYSFQTGEEVNRLEDDFVSVEDNAILTAHYLEGTAQRYNLDFQPVGGRIMLEPSDLGYYLMTAATLDLNWVYYYASDMIIASPEGEKLAECALSIEFVNNISTTDDGFIVARSDDELEVFEFEGGVCRAILARTDFRSFFVDDGYALIADFVGLTEKLKYDVVDLASGQVVMSSEGQVLIGDGYAVTNNEGKATFTRLDDGTEIWSIDVPPDATIRLGLGMVTVLTPNGNNATVEIYADN